MLGSYARTRRFGARAAWADVSDVLDMFPELTRLLDQKAGTLSGGQQQMTALARAMAARPKVLLLDEPCLGLAEAVARRVYDWLAQMTATDMTILLVEENPVHALLVADRAPAGSQISYEFIMPEEQQKKVLAEAPKLKAGDDVAAVLKKLGTPLKDNPNYAKTDAPRGRALSYYFARRSMTGANDFDPLVYVVFDEKGKLFAVTSNVPEVPELNWGAGITAQFGIVH